VQQPGPFSERERGATSHGRECITRSPGERGEPESFFSARLQLCAKLFPGPSGKPANPRPTTHVPFPTSTRLCHKARGCAGRRTTPGSGHITFPTPKGVVPSFRLGTTPRENHGTYLSHRDAESPNPFSQRLGVSARDFFRVPFLSGLVPAGGEIPKGGTGSGSFERMEGPNDCPDS
jgi:hypothetical protein